MHISRVCLMDGIHDFRYVVHFRNQFQFTENVHFVPTNTFLVTRARVVESLLILS